MPHKHRQRVNAILSSSQLFEHQIEAARKIFDAFDENTRAVVTAAEMQSGKSGIALALACHQRLNATDEDIVQRHKLKDSLYLVTMPDTALLQQAENDLKDAKNIVVSNFNHFEREIEEHFKNTPPKLIIIDECHYGSNIEAVRYHRVFDYLEKENDTCRVVFISATPFGALYAAEQDIEAAIEMKEEAEKKRDKKAIQELDKQIEEAERSAILRRSFGTKLVFHRTSSEYYGIREMIKAGKVKGLDQDQRSFLKQSSERDNFMSHFNNHQGAGWSLVRVPASSAMEAKDFFIKQGLPSENIFILGRSLSGVPEDEQITIERFKSEFEQAIDFDEKFIAITVAGCRAGINFGATMKDCIISTWDSTVASVAAVVQANIGRACGYHSNHNAIHFTNLPATEAYAATLDYLEKNTDSDSASDFNGLREFFEDICDEFNVQGLDVGINISRKKRKPIIDIETYKTEEFTVIPAKLHDDNFDYSQYTNDPLFLAAMNLIRTEYLRDYGPKVKGHRAMRGAKKNWLKAQWVNGDSYDNKEKAGKLGTMKEHAIKMTKALTDGKEVEYNQIVMPGSGELTENKAATASIFSIYNKSRRSGISKHVMAREDVHFMCDHFNVEHDDTLVVLYKRGVFDETKTNKKRAENEEPESTSTINNVSQFKNTAEID